MKKIIIVFVAMMLVPLQAYCGWNSIGKIKIVYPNSAVNSVYVSHDSMINPDSCTYNTYYLLDSSLPMTKEMFSTILMSKATSADIQLYISGCSSNGFPLIRHVLLR